MSSLAELPSASETEGTVAESEHDIRVALAAAHRLAAFHGLAEGTWNHFSHRLPGSGENGTRILMTPLNTHWSQVSAGSLREWDHNPDGPRAVGSLTWTGWQIHFPLYAARPDIACALHLHAPYTTALASLKDVRLEPAAQHAINLQSRIAYADEWGGLSPAGGFRGAELAAALGPTADILILKHHGVLVIGPTLGIAYTNLYLTEMACRNQLLAMSSGRELAVVPAEGRRRPSEQWKNGSFNAMLRLLAGQDPDLLG